MATVLGAASPARFGFKYNPRQLRGWGSDCFLQEGEHPSPHGALTAHLRPRAAGTSSLKGQMCVSPLAWVGVVSALRT